MQENIDVSLRVTGGRDSSLRAAGLAEMEVWCVASPAYLKARGMPTRVEELAGHEWIAFSRLPSPWSLRFRVGRRDVTVRVRGRLSVSMSSAGRALALAGAGILGAPDFTLRAEVEAGRLVRLFPQARLPPVRSTRPGPAGWSRPRRPAR